MKVRFVDPGKNIPSSMQKLDYSRGVKRLVKAGINYTVYGIVIWRNVLYYLIFPSDVMHPSWLPAYFFEVSDPRLPIEWYFRHFGDNDPSEIEILMGYKEMVLEKNHYADLIEVDKKAIRIFLDRKQQIDEES